MTELDEMVQTLEDNGYAVATPADLPLLTSMHVFEMTEEAARLSPPSHYSDQSADAWCAGRDEAIETMRETMKWRESQEAVTDA